jgi:hypothetical protein
MHQLHTEGGLKELSNRKFSSFIEHIGTKQDALHSWNSPMGSPREKSSEAMAVTHLFHLPDYGQIRINTLHPPHTTSISSAKLPRLAHDFGNVNLLQNRLLTTTTLRHHEPLLF